MPEITIVAGLGVDGDAHQGLTVKHRSRVKVDESINVVTRALALPKIAAAASQAARTIAREEGAAEAALHIANLAAPRKRAISFKTHRWKNSYPAMRYGRDAMSPRQVGHVYLVLMMMTVGSTMIASRLILGEPVDSVQLAGMLAVIMAIALLSLPHRKGQTSQ